MPDTAETAHITAPRSMAHLLRTTLMAVGILSLLLSVVGAALLFQHAFAEQFDTDLSRTVEAIAVGYEHSADPQPEQLAQYADGLAEQAGENCDCKGRKQKFFEFLQG